MKICCIQVTLLKLQRPANMPAQIPHNSNNRPFLVSSRKRHSSDFILYDRALKHTLGLGETMFGQLSGLKHLGTL